MEPEPEPEAALQPHSRSPSSIGFTVGVLEPEPEPAPPATGDARGLGRPLAGEEDDEEYDSEDWDFDEEYWSDEDEAGDFRRRSLRPQVSTHPTFPGPCRFSYRTENSAWRRSRYRES